METEAWKLNIILADLEHARKTIERNEHLNDITIWIWLVQGKKGCDVQREIWTAFE